MGHEYIEQYSKLSPLERNQELLGLFLLLPNPLYEDFPQGDDWISVPGKGKALDELDRRRKSETHSLATARLKDLLAFSCTTICLQAYIQSDYSEWFIGGIDRKGVTLHPYDGILFKEHNITPGIFDPEIGREIERTIYRQFVFGKLDVERMFRQIYKERGLGSPPMEDTPDWFMAIWNTNSNERFRDPESYSKKIKEAELSAKEHRILLQRWSMEFFTLHQEEI